MENPKQEIRKIALELAIRNSVINEGTMDIINKADKFNSFLLDIDSTEKKRLKNRIRLLQRRICNLKKRI